MYPFSFYHHHFHLTTSINHHPSYGFHSYSLVLRTKGRVLGATTVVKANHSSWLRTPSWHYSHGSGPILFWAWIWKSLYPSSGIWAFVFFPSYWGYGTWDHQMDVVSILPFGRAKKWYAHTIGRVNGNWDELRDKFCLAFFPDSQVGALRIEILTF